MVVIATDFTASSSSTSLDDRKGVCGNSTPPCTPKTPTPAPIDKWHIKSLVMTNSLVSTGWGHHNGPLVELADTHDLGSCAARREGSTPSRPTNILDIKIKDKELLDSLRLDFLKTFQLGFEK